jgi:hypothetical protein
MTTQQKDIFTEFEAYIRPKLEHSVFIDSDTRLVFKSLQNALNCYAQVKQRVLVEHLCDGSYLVHNRVLKHSPMALNDFDAVLKVIGQLC